MPLPPFASGCLFSILRFLVSPFCLCPLRKSRTTRNAVQKDSRASTICSGKENAENLCFVKVKNARL